VPAQIPVFGVILTGYLAGRCEVLGSDSAALNRFFLFRAPSRTVHMARAPAEKIFNWPFIGAFIGGGLGRLLIAVLVGRFLLRQGLANARRCRADCPPSQYRFT